MSELTDLGKSDLAVKQEIERVEAAIRCWLSKYDMADEVWFKSWVEHYDDEPPDWPVLCVVSVDGDACRMVNYDHPVSDGFYELVESLGYVFELDSHSYGWLWHSEEREAALFPAMRDVLQWDWVQRILAPVYADVYAEATDYFSKDSGRLQLLKWRQFEELLHSIFKNNGFRSELGPGGNDGGVDLRLYSNDVFPEALTLVQAKRYSPQNPIGLQAVQALFAAVVDESACNGLLVTTSRYLPGAEAFAQRQNGKLLLAGPEDVAALAALTAEHIRGAQVDATDLAAVRAVLKARPTLTSQGSLVGRIFVSTHDSAGYKHEFALVLKHEGKAVLMVTLPSKRTPDRSSTGVEEPERVLEGPIDPRIMKVVRARVTREDGLAFWGGKQLWTPWDGKPLPFDLND